MNLAIIINNLAGNGAENVCVTLANKFYLLGLSISIITLNLINSNAKNRLNCNVRIFNLNCSPKASLIKMIKCLKTIKPDVVISFFPEITLSILFSKFINYNKFIFVSRCINTLSIKNKVLLENEKNPILYIKKKILFKSIELFFKYSDLIISQCNGMKKDLIGNFGIIPDKCVTIYNPIREGFIFNLDNSKIKDNYILCVGKLLPQKAFDVAIKCFAKISCNYPNLVLIIAGKGQLEEKLKRLTIDLDIENKVIFTGYTDNIKSLYEKAKFTLLTSIYEGFPNNLLESIALGTPIVAFDCPSGPSEIVVEGVNGFLVKNQDEQALINAMDKALNFNWNVESIHKTSLKYSIDNIIPQYITLLNRIIYEAN